MKCFGISRDFYNHLSINLKLQRKFFFWKLVNSINSFVKKDHVHMPQELPTLPKHLRRQPFFLSYNRNGKHDRSVDKHFTRHHQCLTPCLYPAPQVGKFTYYFVSFILLRYSQAGLLITINDRHASHMTYQFRRPLIKRRTEGQNHQLFQHFFLKA